MALDFYFFVSMILMVIYLFSFLLQAKWIIYIISFGIIIIGIIALKDGITNINNILTLGLGSIYIGLGLYTLIAGNVEEIEDSKEAAEQSEG